MGRKGSAKVRTGCVTCKRRKIKCDETRPACRKCTSTGRVCAGYRAKPTGHYSWEELLRPRWQASDTNNNIKIMNAVAPPPLFAGTAALNVSMSVPMALSSTGRSDAAELRGFYFFVEVVAPALDGPLRGSFWTHTVPRVYIQESAVREATLAVSLLYEYHRIGWQQQWENRSYPAAQSPRSVSMSTNHHLYGAAIRHYNSAIKHLVASKTMNVETVLVACVIFICIEFLTGQGDVAIRHVTHGLTLLNNLTLVSSETELSVYLASFFCHLGIFPFFFSERIPDIPDIPPPFDIGSIPVGSSFVSETEAQAALDLLLCRSVRLVRMAAGHKFNTKPKPDFLLDLGTLVAQQKKLQDDLALWWYAFSAMHLRLNLSNEREMKVHTHAHDDDNDEEFFALLEVRWLVAQIWSSTCLTVNETEYDAHFGSFQRIIHLAKRAKMKMKTRISTTTSLGEPSRGIFSFNMGFGPLIHFVVLKCRYLPLRLEALSLQPAIACLRESMWDCATMSAIGTRIVEMEHGIKLDAAAAVDSPSSFPSSSSTWTSASVAEIPVPIGDGSSLDNLPSNRMRILDYSLEDVERIHIPGWGEEVVRRKITLLVKTETGAIEARQDWVLIR
ncbi:Zn(2)-C6 fungal-type domain-containing protein [Trichoderma simmonsii]|uniref:Zn(2)-C6 fungal-type domain-containing protein n=1 Tax=Trichoderma simmonsii TaxID=1491479 RepID=A0A8G0LG43_9HYPO|nr:Zn(2)-C6 fungal-type domain-containing protein [Trichoderma simmonsii]